MIILNRSTGVIQGCENNDAIKSCQKDPSHYVVAESREELDKKVAQETEDEPGEDEPEVENPEKGSSEGHEEDAKGTEDRLSEEVPEEDILSRKGVTELRKIAKEMKIQGYTNMNKETLVAMIINH